MGNKSGPSAPDYTAAAAQQGAESRANTEQQTWANRPTVNTPWGQQTWASNPVWDPTTEQYLNQWQMDVNLTPDQQQALDSQMRVQSGRSSLAEGMMDSMGAEATRQVDWQGLPERAGELQNTDQYRQNAEDALYRKATSRLDPMWQGKEAAMETNLYNKGFRPGDAGYDAAATNLGQQRNDAYQQAIDSAAIGGRAEAQSMQGMDITGGNYQNTQRASQLSEEMQRQGWSLNQINAMLSGQQVQMPQTPSFNQAGVAQASPYLQAAEMTGQSSLDSYNAGQGQIQGMLSGAAALAPYAFSDIRLKHDVKDTGADVIPGVPIVTWRWRGDTSGKVHVGVLAQDVERVRPDLAVTHQSGYKMVNYGALLGGVL